MAWYNSLFYIGHGYRQSAYFTRIPQETQILPVMQVLNDTTGSEKFRGNAERISVRATLLPLDTPITTS